jgi:hypothetical protein
MPALRKALGPGWEIQALTMHECPAEDLTVRDGDKSFPECDAHHEFAAGWIAGHRPDLVVAVDTPSTVERIVDAPTTAKAFAEFTSATDTLMSRLASQAQRAVVLEAPPKRSPLQQCKLAASRPADCVIHPTSDYETFGSAQKAAIAALALPTVSFVPAESWFCINGLCPSFVENASATSDGSHLTEPASERLGPLLAEALGAVGVPEVTAE